MKPSHDVKRQVSTERVEAGADVEAQAAARLRTAEDIAARGGHVDVVEVARTGELLSFSHTLSLSRTHQIGQRGAARGEAWLGLNGRLFAQRQIRRLQLRCESNTLTVRTAHKHLAF
jgi:hypothetical protein